MHLTDHIRRFISLVGICLLCLLAACSANVAPTTKGITPTAGIKLPAPRNIMPVIASATMTMPQTQTAGAVVEHLTR